MNSGMVLNQSRVGEMQINMTNIVANLSLALILTAGIVTSINAVQIDVGTFSDVIDSNDGLCSLREAIINANNNDSSGSSDCASGSIGEDVITLPAGTYTLSIAGRSEDASQTGDLDITDVSTGSSIVIAGMTDANGDPATIIDAAGIDRIFDIFNPANKGDFIQSPGFSGVMVTLQNLKLVNGYVEEAIVAVDNQANGGAVFSWRFNDLTISNCEFDNNHVVWDLKYGVIDPDMIPGNEDDIEERTLSGHGGAVYSRGNLSIQNSTFSNNVAYTVNDENMDGIIEGENEKSGNGGGVFTAFPSLIENSTFIHNTASNGGGLNTTGGDPATSMNSMTITGSTFVDNWAVMGGGINNVSPQVTLDIINSTFSANTTTDMGAGVNSDATVHFKHVTVVDNKVLNSDQNGAGINYFGPAGDLFLYNSLLSNNKGKDTVINCGCTGGTMLACSTLDVTTMGGNISSDFNCGLDTANGDLRGPDPKLLPLADNGGPTQTHAFEYDSLAIDFGKDINCIDATPAINIDQRGVTRPEDGNGDGVNSCDVGAYERRLANADLVLTNLGLNLSSIAVDDELTVAVSVGNAGPETVTSVHVDIMLPAELYFVSGSVVGGAACSASGNIVDCALDDMGASASSNIEIIATALDEGAFSITAIASALEIDTDTGNNSAETLLTINPKVVVVSPTGGTSSDDGGGFCSYNPSGKLDIVLPTMLLIAIGGLGWRRYRAAFVVN